MTNLTDKWKKGELENGTYYVRLNHDSSTIDVFDCGVWWNNAWHEITEVLEEVPSYNEWQEKLDENEKLKSKLQLKETAYDFDTARLEEENIKLKGLLKELKRYFDADGKYYIEKRILLEINQVLGEE